MRGVRLVSGAASCQNPPVTRASAGVPILLLDGIGNGKLIQEHEPLPEKLRYAVKPHLIHRFCKTEVFHEGARIYLLDGVKTVPRVRGVLRDVG